MNRRLSLVIASVVSLGFGLLGAGVGCAAPTAEDEAGESTGAATTGAYASRIDVGAYRSDDGKIGAWIQREGTGLFASIVWSRQPFTIDSGDLDVPLGDRSIGSNDDTGSDGDGGVKCPFTVRAVNKYTIRVTSKCGRGDAELRRGSE